MIRKSPLNAVFLAGLTLLIACSGKAKKHADMLVLDARIHSMDSTDSVFTGMAIKDGKIVEMGDAKEIEKKFDAKEILRLPGKFIYPGLIDPHSHFYGLSESLANADLRNSRSEEDMIARVNEFVEGRNDAIVYGRGWDENLWPEKTPPDNTRLNEAFPDRPVFLSRIDGHAALVNQKTLELAGITKDTKVDGGAIVVEDGKLTGLLIDNAVDLVTRKLPARSHTEISEMLLRAQEECFKNGLSTVCDAGLDKSMIMIYDSLQKAGKLKIRIYAMANPWSPTIDWLLENGPLKTERLNVRSVKFYMDGAMGSRGACLKSDYSDTPGHRGFFLNSPDSLRTLAQKLYGKGLQLNVHCIGDSANGVVLKIMKEVLGDDKGQRWRIEHVQLIDSSDIHYFEDAGIIPSMQPTHATSDAAWVTNRIGADRLRYAYALKTLLSSAKTIALGTDFPVEEVSPMYTYFAAISRTHPVTGNSFDWLKNEKLGRLEALRGMTMWAAYAQFEDKEKGSLEPGKWADFVVYGSDLLTMDESQIPTLKPEQLYIEAEKVYSQK